MADYSINAIARKVSYTGSAGVGPYAFSFEVLDETDVAVYKNATLLTLTTDYTVTVNANGTGSVTLVVAATAADTIVILGARDIERTTDFVTAGDLRASSLNEQLDSLTIFDQQIDERVERSIKAPPYDPTGINMVLPSKADRADKLLKFDTEGNVEAAGAADVFTGTVLGANYVSDTFTGNGSTTAYTLTTAPGSKLNTQVYIDGVYQEKSTYSLTGSTLTFTEAPPLNASIEVISGDAVSSFASDASQVNYDQGGTGFASRTVESKLQEFVSVKDFGAVGDGVTDDTAAIQAALDASSGVHIPEGQYVVSNTLYMNDNNYIIGNGRGSYIAFTGAGSCFAGKDVTPASGTNVRRYNGGGMNFMIYGPGTGGSTIGLDMRGCTAFKWDNVLIQNIHTGIRHGDGYSTYYNEYRAVDISTVTYGVYSDTLGNENTFIGGRVNDCDTGTFDSDNSHNKYIGVAVETITSVAHEIGGAAADHIHYGLSRIENAVTAGTAFDINSNAIDTQIMSPQISGMSSDILDAGTNTNVVASEYWKISGGTRIKIHQSVKQAIDFPSLSAGTTNDQLVSITGVLATDSAFVTADASIGTGLMVMAIPANGGVYVRMANITSGAIDPPSLTFTIDIWRHG